MEKYQHTLQGIEVEYLDAETSDVVLVVDDHEIVRQGMCGLIRKVRKNPWSTVREAESVAEALKVIGEERNTLSLIFLDLSLTDSKGVDTYHQVQKAAYAIPIVIVSASEDWGQARYFFDAGARGYICKSSNVTVMTNAMSLVLAGERYFPNGMYDLVGDRLVVADRPAPLDVSPPPVAVEKPAFDPDFSPRLKQVFLLLEQGATNKEIARALGITTGTVKNYVSMILRAANSTSRMKAVNSLKANGTFSDPE